MSDDNFGMIELSGSVGIDLIEVHNPRGKLMLIPINKIGCVIPPWEEPDWDDRGNKEGIEVDVPLFKGDAHKKNEKGKTYPEKTKHIKGGNSVVHITNGPALVVRETIEEVRDLIYKTQRG